jgi:serine/threonine protein kinase
MYRAKRAASLRAKRRRLGKYELGRTIGEGTFAKVRVAKNMDTGDHVAIKILDKAKVHKNKLAEQVDCQDSRSTLFAPAHYFRRSHCLPYIRTAWQIRREICTMKLIQHPNVVRLYEVKASTFPPN